MTDDRNQCPTCNSRNISIGYPDIICHSCGHREPLYDFPISWDWHRALMVANTGIDPGPGYPSAPPEVEVEEPRPEPEWTRRQWDYVQQLKACINYLENKLNEHIDKTQQKQGKGDKKGLSVIEI